MSLLRRISRLVSAPTDTPELALAQWRALSRQIPLMYIMLVSNTLIVAWTHFGVAPVELTVYVPTTLAMLCIVRMWSGGAAGTRSWTRTKRAPICGP